MDLRENLPFEPPIKRNVINERITPNTSTVSNVCILPVFGSGRSNSKLLPRDTKISCDLVPEKLPCTACVIAVECCNVKLYKYMILIVEIDSTRRVIFSLNANLQWRVGCNAVFSRRTFTTFTVCSIRYGFWCEILHGTRIKINKQSFR